MAAAMPAIDLTEDDDDVLSKAHPTSCANPNHAVIVSSMRQQLLEQQRAKEVLQQRINSKDADIANRQARIADLQARDVGRLAEIRRLQARIDTLEDRLNSRGKRQQRTWPNKLRAFIVDGARQPSYESIYTLCCKEENMSTNTSFTHPQVRLSVSANGWKADDADDHQNNGTVASPYFEALPAKVQARIFRMWLQKERTVHCFSRLDPFAVPASWPISHSSSGMYNRFYWGEERLLNLEKDSVCPQDILGLLLVSKSFYFKGVHAFYGLNTFAFSSIGEFGRFCKGIGRQRVARLQHIEITWTGSQYLTAEHTFSDRQIEKWDSVRTRPFAFLLHLRRLRTLAIFLNESGHSYQRRKYESSAKKAQLLHRTLSQPNFRENRSLRTLQGVDYVYALRGLDWVRLYDAWPMISDPSLNPPLRKIRDRSFVEDVNRAATMRKSVEEARDCELRNLPPLFPLVEAAAAERAQATANRPMRPWNPSDANWLTVQHFYTTSNARGARQVTSKPTRTYYGIRDLNPVVPDKDGDDSTRNGHPDDSRRSDVQAGPSRLQRPTIGPARRPVPPAQRSPSAAGPSRHGDTAQKRPSPGACGNPCKRQRQAEAPPSQDS